MICRNPEAFEEFRTKWLLWQDCISGKGRHSVMNQVYHLVWDAAVWNIINESRRHAEKLPDGGLTINGMTHSLIDRCFFQSQMIAIRRLVDVHGIEGRKGVYCLTSLLRDMRSNANLIRREHISSIEDLPYDYAPIQEAQRRWVAEKTSSGKTTFWIPDDLDWETIEERHREIDKWCDVTKAKRTREDAVHPQVLKALETKLLAACTTIKEHVDKFVAHAATPESRSSFDPKETSVTLAHLDAGRRVICGIANRLSVFLTRSDHGFLPTPQFDQFKFMDRALIRTEDIEALSEAWDRFKQETETWADLEWGGSHKAIEES